MKHLFLMTMGLVASSLLFAQSNQLFVNLVSPEFNCGFNISCPGLNDGAIFADVQGGVPPYSFNWSTGDNTPQINGLAAGNYSVDVIDQVGNVVNAGINLSEPDDFTVITDGIFDGTGLMCVIDGGCPPYEYEWDHGGTNELETQLPPDVYTVTATDQNGCTVQANVTIPDISCGNKNKKVQICHFPPGNAGNSSTLCVNPNSGAAHEAHGCLAGDCGAAGGGFDKSWDWAGHKREIKYCIDPAVEACIIKPGLTVISIHGFPNFFTDFNLGDAFRVAEKEWGKHTGWDFDEVPFGVDTDGDGCPDGCDLTIIKEKKVPISEKPSLPVDALADFRRITSDAMGKLTCGQICYNANVMNWGLSGGATYDPIIVMMHELGHAMRLKHVCGVPAGAKNGSVMRKSLALGLHE
ncbi:MAG: hypothetical protein IH946_08455, partial [Bacteroidetes bacterium]|nr:hypothetical protein [Bacteroidota bacterium]